VVLLAVGVFSTVWVGFDAAGSVMDQIGRTDPGFTLRVYRHGMHRDDAAKARLQALVGGAALGSSKTQAPWTELSAGNSRSLKAA